MPILKQGLVRSIDPDGRSDADHDRHADRVIQAINDEGTAFFSGTFWHGRRAMRISVVNWRTSEIAVRMTVEAVARVLARTGSAP